MSKKLSQTEIDALIAGMISGEVDPSALDGIETEAGDAGDAGASLEAAAAPPEEAPAAPVDLGPISQAEVDAVLREGGKGALVSSADAGPVISIDPPIAAPGLGIAPPAAAMPPAPAAAQPAPAATQPRPWLPAGPAAQILLDLELTLTAELVRTRMRLNQLLGLQPGSVLELDRLANEPVDVIINGHPMMKAKVVTMGEFYGIQVTETRLGQKAAS
jgi:flagellar motor switch protein FliN/FliY